MIKGIYSKNQRDIDREEIMLVHDLHGEEIIVVHELRGFPYPTPQNRCAISNVNFTMQRGEARSSEGLCEKIRELIIRVNMSNT